MNDIRELDDFPGYFVSDTGALMNSRGKVLKLRADKDGYLRTNLYKEVNGVKQVKTVFLHRLVAQTFIPNSENYPVVDHIDRDTTNNHVSNLRWATISENTLNSGMSNRNTSGFKCISFIKSRNKFQLCMIVNGKNTFIGYFDTVDDAAKRWNELAPEYYKEFQPIGINVQNR
jgi:HNH endonuclease